MNWLYLGILLFSLCGLTLADYRWKLALFTHPIRTLVTLAASVFVFLRWDLIGIKAGVFFPGNNPWSLGLMLAPGMPVEEPVFLVLLSYSLLLAYLGSARLLTRGNR